MAAEYDLVMSFGEESGHETADDFCLSGFCDGSNLVEIIRMATTDACNAGATTDSFRFFLTI